MGVSRNILLWVSENKFLSHKVPKWSFVRRAAKKFMPGETMNEASTVAAEFFNKKNIPTIFTRLGENITNLDEAKVVTEHYLNLIDLIVEQKLHSEVSLKLTQIGFDLSISDCYMNFKKILNKAEELGPNNILWIDMEGGSYTQSTVDFYKKVKSEHNNVGICLQAYLYSTGKIIRDLMNLNPSIRLVKGAYNESEKIAFPKKKNVDENYFNLSKLMLNNSDKFSRIAFATHDLNLIERIWQFASSTGLKKNEIEIEMLYGIKSNDQIKLKDNGLNVIVLISYGEKWFPWYMRRLAERPANILFVLKNIFS